jgi:hypothetical protein
VLGVVAVSALTLAAAFVDVGGDVRFLLPDEVETCLLMKYFNWSRIIGVACDDVVDDGPSSLPDSDVSIVGGSRLVAAGGNSKPSETDPSETVPKSRLSND